MGSERALSKSGHRTMASISTEVLAKGLRIIEGHFPKLNMTKDQIDVWRVMLSDLNNEQFIRGVKTFCLAHREIYPTTNVIAHIRQYALTDPNRKTSAEAWGEVLREVSRVGFYGEPRFSTDEVKRAVDCVGWKAICLSEQIGVERAHFMKAYDGIVQRDTFNAVARAGEGGA